MKEPLISSDQAAVYLAMKRKTLLDHYRAWGIPFYKVGVHVKFRVSELDQWLSERKETPTR